MRAALVAAAVAACLLAAGCGDSEEGTTSTGEPTATEASTSAPPEDTTISRCEPPECEEPSDVLRAAAKDTIDSYFAALAGGDTDAAWALLSPDVQEQFGGFDTWSAGIDARESTEVISIEDAAGPDDMPAFDVEVRTVEGTSCGVSAERTFSGTWTVEPAGDDALRIASVQQALVAGPPDLETVCATGGY